MKGGEDTGGRTEAGPPILEDLGALIVVVRGKPKRHRTTEERFSSFISIRCHKRETRLMPIDSQLDKDCEVNHTSTYPPLKISTDRVAVRPYGIPDRHMKKDFRGVISEKIFGWERGHSEKNALIGHVCLAYECTLKPHDHIEENAYSLHCAGEMHYSRIAKYLG